MSKTRWDRKRRTEEWKSEYFPLMGGLDQASSALAIKPGRLVQCLNFEEVFGEQGYRFVKGYERFHGWQYRPSQMAYYVIEFTAGNNAATPAEGDLLRDQLGAATLTYITRYVLSGSLAAGDAAGYIIVSGDFSAGAPELDAGSAVIHDSSGLTIATAAHDIYRGSSGLEQNEDATRLTREYFRSLIAQVPGAGPILGGAVFKNMIFAVRATSASSGYDANLYCCYASGTKPNGDPAPNGWQTMVAGGFGFHMDTKFRFAPANFTGDPSNIFLYMVNGKDCLRKIDADNLLVYRADPIYGSQATSNTLVTLGNGAKTFTVNEGARSYQTGDDVTAWQFGAARVWMRGTVVNYNAGTGQLDLNVFDNSANAANADNWEIGRSDFVDKPFLLQPHKNHMFLGYPRGQLQTSNLGDPMVYTSTASLFGMGQELKGLVSLKGKALGVFCERRIDVIEGSSATDWDKQPYSEQSGAILDTTADNDGNPIFLDARGLSTLLATQNFGDLQASTFSRDVKKLLDANRSKVIGARMAVGNLQYRLYLNDGGCLRMTLMGGGAQVSARNVSGTFSRYEHEPTCTFEGVIDGEERMFFGTSDGYVMEEDCGTSFDGEAIYYALRLPYDHLKSPGMEKQFHKMDVEVTSPQAVTFYFRSFFDYDDGEFHYGGDEMFLPQPGGLFDDATFDTFAFSATTGRLEKEVDGQGRNVALLLWAESDMYEPATLQGVMTYFSYLGIKR